MRHIHDETIRKAYNTVAEMNRHLDDPRVTRNPKNHYMVTQAKAYAVRTLKDLNALDRMDDRRPYTDTNIGYRSDENRHLPTIHKALDTIGDIIPHLVNNLYNDWKPYSKRGVPGTGRYGDKRKRRKGTRAEMDNRYDDRYNYNSYDYDYNDRNETIYDDRQDDRNISDYTRTDHNRGDDTRPGMPRHHQYPRQDDRYNADNRR